MINYPALNRIIHEGLKKNMFNTSYTLLRREWRSKKPMWWVMPFELAGVVATLVLFGIAQPDLYRTQLWRIGYLWGFNSNPNMIVYSYANNAPYPDIPFVWSLELTNFNVAISVLSLFVLLSKLIAFIMKVWYPLVGVIFSATMTALYATSVAGQMGPDYADPAHPSPVAWYIRTGCWPAEGFANNAVRSCQLAKGTFAVTVYMLAVYLYCLGIASYSMIPSTEERRVKTADDDSEASPVDTNYEMMPAKHEPFTPRTQAFHTLDRKLPLRERFQ